MTIDKKSLKVAVLMGGIGEERQVSLESGKCVSQAMRDAGLNVVTSDITPENMEILDDDSIDVFFLALHGRFGEDGELQQIMEDKGLIYTGSSPEASRLAFDKIASKKAFVEAGIDTPPLIEIKTEADLNHLEKQLQLFADRYVVKPVKQGSSVGISIVNKASEVFAAAKNVLRQFGDCMIEKFIPGREITVGVLCGQVLPLIEVRPKTAFYDYHAKYIADSTEYLFDTVKDAAAQTAIGQTAKKCFDALGLRDFARIDVIVGADGKIYALEANTIPGFTSHSLLPKAAAKVGYPMADLCVKIIEAALERNKVRSI
jgi:D-alanine-D-alanine ligase